MLLRLYDYEAFGMILLLTCSAFIVFPAFIASVLLFYFAREKKEQEIEEAKQNGTEPTEKHRMMNLIGFILLIPLFIWIFYFLKLTV